MQGGFMGSGYIRRLPVYLLLDCSGSMAGDPIVAVNEGLSMIYRLLMNDPQALETVYLSVICFSSRVDQYQLVSLDQFQPPQLTANGSTAMGEALRILAQSIEQDLVLNTPTQHGDFRPLVFLLTDGEPTDNYRSAVALLQQLRGSRKPTIVALGCGSGVNTSMLHEVTSNVFLMHTVSQEAIRAFFKWISGSIAQTSRALGSSNPDQTTMMAPPTIPGIMYSPN
jgi:uncharacterized protein YegL